MTRAGAVLVAVASALGLTLPGQASGQELSPEARSASAEFARKAIELGRQRIQMYRARAGATKTRAARIRPPEPTAWSAALRIAPETVPAGRRHAERVA